jgi:hypothetical protein
MQERVVRCEWTNARQIIETDADLPNGWLEIPSIMIGNETDEGEELENLHFLNFDALSKWAASKALSGKVYIQPRQRVWQSDHGREG